MIEESEERLKTDQEIEDLLNVIATKLPSVDGDTQIQSSVGQDKAGGQEQEAMES